MSTTRCNLPGQVYIAAMSKTFDAARARFFKEARLRRATASRLRNAGMTFQQIGDKFGVSRQRAQAMVKKAAEEAAA